LSDIQTTKTVGRIAAASLILGGIGLGTGTTMVMLESKYRSSEKKTLSIRPSLNGVTFTSAF
jgi:hypothetical protein